jgi:acetyl-CoA carboxylase biotin carboxyl carrier protein
VHALHEADGGKSVAEIKIVTEVAGRVCAIAASMGGSIGIGDDVVFVEAMKMEIPVPSPAAGKIKSILVSVDDVVAEGQTIATLEA